MDDGAALPLTIPAGQAAAAALLARLTGADAPIETHISAVFVGRDRVLKLKKAVALGFLDFSAPASRRRFLDREFALNAPLAPGFYRGVHGIAGDRIVAADDPAATEWVLEMAPAAPGDFLDAVAADGRLDDRLLDGLGDAVARMQVANPVVRDVDAPARFASVLRGNARAAVAAGLPRDRVVAWRRAAEGWLRRLAPVLARRAAGGFVRRCHGDLHLGNLVLLDGVPTPFDALEFDEDLATIDVGYDLAFLLADLVRRAGRGAATRVLARAVARTGDAGLVAGLPLWLSTRATIRAHCLARLPGGMPRGLDFLGDAEAALRPPPPVVIAVGGVQGTGKTHLARRLAPRVGASPGALHLRSDETRKRLAGVAPEERLPPDAYAPDRSEAVHAALFGMAEDALRGGHAVVLDAMFLDPAVRATAAAVARRAGVPFLGLWLEAPAAVLEARVAARTGDASDATVEVLRQTLAADPGLMGWARLDATDDPLPAALGAMAGVARAESC